MSCLPDKLTPCTPVALYASLERAWVDGSPSRESLLVLLSHWALETGWGHAMHWFNIGNRKHVDGDGRDYTMLRCNEVIGGHVVWLDPPNPGTWFVAFQTLDEGAADYLAGLRKQFALAWPAVLAGDVAQFCHLLKVQHYYTADEAQYTATASACYRQLDGILPRDLEPLDRTAGPGGVTSDSADTLPPDPGHESGEA